MPTVEELWNHGVTAPDGTGEWEAGHVLSWVARHQMNERGYAPDGEGEWTVPHLVAWTARAMYKQQAQITALTTAVEVLAQNSNVSPEEVKAAVAAALQENVLSVDIDVQGKEVPE